MATTTTSSPPNPNPNTQSRESESVSLPTNTRTIRPKRSGMIQHVMRMRLATGVRSSPFAGRLGGNQEFVVDRENPENAVLLERMPDAAPNLSLREAFDLRGFAQAELYRAAVIEGIGTLVFTFSSAYNSLSPYEPPPLPSPTSGVFSTAAFLGPLIGSIITIITLSLLIYSLGAISGGHMNPLITIGTFFARLTTFPRLVLYLCGQLAGASLAGLLLRSAADTRSFKVGGCYLFQDMASVRSALAIEFVGDLLLLIMAFGVGLDPRQAELFGPALGPVLVGLAAGSTALSLAFSKPGYGGASLNPARCFGVFVGSSFPSWAWVTWVGPIAASLAHGVMYFVVPPMPVKGRNIGEVHAELGQRAKEKQMERSLEDRV
ncbi:hypothetical protein PV10_07305 [Exophiala mesophila]|uniref:Aquaporin n=1 Tax=Exophiala mesophila TaxID=212818 RepID=A0A0D1XPD0_EXOME|nr:uncharacterized protein PV10_07305 [Exophiala mesophila]KIV89951.1 hypothetical protein PV10_07305 [Exophiala mesophila]